MTLRYIGVKEKILEVVSANQPIDSEDLVEKMVTLLVVIPKELIRRTVWELLIEEKMIFTPDQKFCIPTVPV